MDRRTTLKLMSLAAVAHTLPRAAAAASGTVTPAPGMPAPREVATNGIRMGLYERGAGIPVVFCHGFPELAFSWRHQFHAAAAAGFRAIAPDLRGSGLTEAPPQIDAYTTPTVCDDLVGMLDAMNVERAVFCGHDWGSFVVDTMNLLYPERCLGIVSIGAPHNHRPPDAPRPALDVQDIVDKAAYNRWMQQPDVPERLLDENVEGFFRTMFRADYLTADRVAALPSDAPERSLDLAGMIASTTRDDALIVPRAALEYYVSTFRATGFTGSVNWYRAMEATWAQIDRRDLNWAVDVPYLYIWPEQDPIVRTGVNVGMEDYIADLETRTLAGSGHFAMEDRPEALSALIVDWLSDRFSAPSASRRAHVGRQPGARSRGRTR